MRGRYRKAGENLLALALLAFLALLVSYPVLLYDKAPIATDSVLFAPPWEEARPAGLEGPSNPALHAMAEAYYPWYAFLSDSAARQDWPLWNPYEGCGVPFLAIWRSRCLSPFSLPFYFLPVTAALKLSSILKLVIAGWAAFYAARRLGFRVPLALMVGAAFELSGVVFMRSSWPISDTVVWLPFLFLFSERLVLGHARYWPLGAAALGLMFLGGDPEATGGAVLLVFVFTFSRVLLARKQPEVRMPSLVALAAGLGFGVSLAAVQILPFIELWRESVRTGPGPQPNILHVADLMNALFPFFLGRGPGLMIRDGVQMSVLLPRLLYVGLAPILAVPLWLAVRGFADKAQRARIDAIAATAGVMTCLAFVWPRLLGGVPVVGRLQPQHFLVGNAFLFALLAAGAALEWVELDPEECHSAILRLTIAIPAVLLAALILLVTLRHNGNDHVPSSTAQAALMAGLAAAFVILLATTAFRPSPRLIGYLLCGIMVVDLFLAFHPAVIYTPTELLFPETDFIASLKATGTRAGGTATLRQWPLSGNLIPQLHAPSGVGLTRHEAFVKRLEKEPLLLRRAGCGALLLTKQDIQTTFAPVRPLLRIRRVFPSGAVLFDDLEAKPRAWLKLEGDAPGQDEPSVSMVTQERNNEVVVHVESPQNAGLVLADAWYPGWVATVGGERVPVEPEEDFFRRVRVPAGAHDVVFTYKPLSVRLGLYVSCGAAVIVLYGLISILTRRFKRRR